MLPGTLAAALPLDVNEASVVDRVEKLLDVDLEPLIVIDRRV